MSDTVVKEKRASVSAETFVSAYAKGVKSGKSNKVIAAELGMQVATFNVRLSQLRKKAKAGPGPNPFDSLPKRSRASVDVVGMLRDTLAELDTPAVGETPVVETTEG